MSFMIDQQDRVYQANLGEESAAKAQEITRFTPTLTPAGRWQNLKKNARLHSRNRRFIHLALVRHQRRIAGKGWFCAG